MTRDPHVGLREFHRELRLIVDIVSESEFKGEESETYNIVMMMRAKTELHLWRDFFSSILK